jgi:hypothetical protein
LRLLMLWLLLPGLERYWNAHHRVVEMVHHPCTAKGDHASQQHAGQCVHKDHEQAREGAEDPLGTKPKLPFRIGHSCQGTSTSLVT